MRELTAEYLGRHRLFADVERYVDTVVHFARFCTPPGTSDEGLACACMYMAWVLYLDDVSDGSVGEIGARTVDRYCRLVWSLHHCDGHQEPSSSAEHALAELVSRVKRVADHRALAAREFCERVIEMMRAQLWERERSKVATSFSRSEYLQHRPAAIGNGAFVSIMKLDHAVDVGRFDQLEMARVVLLDELTTRLVYLSNDILSEHREASDASALSLVRVIAEETGLPWSEAVEQAVATHQRDVDSYRRVRQELLENGHPDTARLVLICDTDVAGNLAAMAFIHSRYRAT
jgi:hypothetical protein